MTDCLDKSHQIELCPCNAIPILYTVRWMRRRSEVVTCARYPPDRRGRRCNVHSPFHRSGWSLVRSPSHVHNPFHDHPRRRQKMAIPNGRVATSPRAPCMLQTVSTRIDYCNIIRGSLQTAKLLTSFVFSKQAHKFGNKSKDVMHAMNSPT